MKVGILASKKTEWHVLKLLDSLKARSAEAFIVPPTRLTSRIGGIPRVDSRGYAIEDFDALLVRKVPGGTPEQVFYRMDVLHRLEEMGVYVMNTPDGIERSVDKYYTSGLLDGAGIKTPRTIVTERFEEAMDAYRDLGGDVVVKPIFGSLGAGMTRVVDEDVAYRVFRALEAIGSVFYVQEYIPHRNEDVRAFVVGGRVVASMLRKAGKWKTNIAGGGKATPYKPSELFVNLALKAAKTVGLDYTGVDILTSETDGEAYVIEVNSTPGWEGLQTVTDMSIADVVVDHLLSKVS